MKTLNLRGIPHAVQIDGWWINKDSKLDRSKSRTPNFSMLEVTKKRGFPILVLIVLLAIADMMFWGVAAGISLAAFGGVILVTAYIFGGRKGAGGIAVGTLFFLPVVEQVQALSVMFWILGLAIGAGWIALSGWPGFARLLTAALRFLQFAPRIAFTDARSLELGNAPKINIRTMIAGWALPLGLGMVFVSLLASANPMIENWLETILNPKWLAGLNASRIVFWLGVAISIWPFLRLSGLRERLKLPFGNENQQTYTPNSLLFNAVSVRRSLILFNLVFAIQTSVDITYLWGGAVLPDGMNHAEYVHRGAYPLLVMAIMAGIFALLSRPFVRDNKILKTVLLIWVAQTILMVLSSLYRLELYVETYGLTRLRLAAFLWMAVVTIGLMMVIWQVVRDHNAKWLLVRTAMLGVVTLYSACFYSFDRSIAHYNLTQNVRADRYYICGLGSAALPEIIAYEQHAGVPYCDSRRPWAPQMADTFKWQEWGFRDWRTTRTLASINQQGVQE